MDPTTFIRRLESWFLPIFIVCGIAGLVSAGMMLYALYGAAHWLLNH